MHKNEKTLQDLTYEDFNGLIKNCKVDIQGYETRSLLFPQTILGRVRKGHGIFNENANPEIEISKILKPLDIPKDAFLEERQKYIDEFNSCLNNIIQGKRKICGPKEEPLFRLQKIYEQFKQIDSPKNFLKGAYLVSMMDTPKWRKETLKYYPKDLDNTLFKMGYGKEYPIRMEILKENNISIQELQEESHSDEKIIELIEKGIICSKGKDLKMCYIRHKTGAGICDDKALIAIGKIYGIEAMIGGFYMDATDTYTKFTSKIVNKGWDEYLGEKIFKEWKEKYHEPIATSKEIMEIIYLGAKNNMKSSKTFSSSHRRFIESEEKQENPTFLNHIDFVQNGTKKEFKLGFEREDSIKFYQKEEKIFMKYEEQKNNHF
jgi:hypothetical protein